MVEHLEKFCTGSERNSVLLQSNNYLSNKQRNCWPFHIYGTFLANVFDMMCILSCMIHMAPFEDSVIT